MSRLMDLQSTSVSEALATLFTLMRFLPRVYSPVRVVVSPAGKALPTLTVVWPLLCAHACEP